MLGSLRSIVQEVNAARDLSAVLDIIVRRVREVMRTRVCSVYLRDKQSGDYVLMATRGLNPDAVGQVHLAPGEGLVGNVVTREEPINLEQAEAHPAYQYFPATGEERFSAFLGTPIIHHREVLGVLVVQQAEMRRFDEGEEAFLVTLAAQLAGVIAHAEATGALAAIGQQRREAKFSGIAASPGVAIGRVHIVAPPTNLASVPYSCCIDVDAELALFHTALASAREEIRDVGERLKDQLSREERALFDAYISMLDDNSLTAEVCDRIRQQISAPRAWAEVMLEHVRRFEAMSDSYFRDRAADVRDLGARVLMHLRSEQQSRREFSDNTILVGEEVTAAVLAEVPQEKLAGLVSVKGSSNSHVAIIARAMGLPSVMGVQDLPYEQIDGADIVVDGYRGELYVHPGAELRRRYDNIVEEERELARNLDHLASQPAETADGHRVRLMVNTGLMADVVRSLERGAEGVGLYRTEVPFLLRDRFPSEEEQREIYREQLLAFAPRTVTMRTLDIGGDKALVYFPIDETNPFLGWRGIRVTLDHPEIFLAQVRAMMKASLGLDNLRIMLPMVTGIGELEAARKLVKRAHRELQEEGYDIAMPPLGIMIEVPSAVYQARELAERADFISVGSNDLTQYLLAVDRNNSRVASFYHPLHPAVLRALHQVVEAGHAAGTKVGICGELAGEPGGALLLMAMGYDMLSMNATNLPRVKSALRAVNKADTDELLKQVMVMESPEEIEKSVQAYMKQVGLKALLQPTEDGNHSGKAVRKE
ncbi:phosphoenolpyruvate--protein phosphotransferase [Microbulbifer thermotolerans]|uniref:phosphoenolpyruvate--protein phosphotransferase n=1 Tax=Microbulbifer thermotolerans TaxID=252514 RepID=A0A143HP91_MICTH|nr:phosphoenolpyruvate--protein phosphotransferase [Microbulbifer thermotolerans]AMX03555.1 phosphoenolpyruvate--protein phosphotransferase [Microbulbifer thermotolerans]MCX2778180.1 phosphoenolpyruvate--protein phosphotransferase [Microbulbifer thermotolerans]MCX2782186.1 phosphoenolpyruvate--protein phosphotransferase [Microbulbifer thermotolerans]MCX2795278.1 phosphoenolpyruvate--protein phosphotransferase [Microbulbifer thermotolerans]MCX2801160.1 phosphoenolpyruvate--protein phosphotransf